MPKNCRVLLYTDGIYEVEGADEMQYDQEMLFRAIRNYSNLPGMEILDRLIDEISEFSTSKKFMDDVCLVAMEIGDLETKES